MPFLLVICILRFGQYPSLIDGNYEMAVLVGRTAVSFLRLFLNGAFWALIGGTSAVITKNRYMSYAVPFILYYVLTVFQERYYQKAFFLSPRYDMYPFYWTSSERGIFMRYTYEFKKKAVELYRQGKWIDAPNDIINLKNFHDMIVRWHHLEESNTSDCLKHYGTNKKWSPEEKYELVARVIAGDTITSVAYTVGINSGLLAQWIRKYKIWGYNGLVGRRKGRKPKESAMKKMNINNPRKLNESEYEELIRLRAEITYIKAENEAIKKEIALREEREAALLKAKKQQSSKNSKKKDIC